MAHILLIDDDAGLVDANKLVLEAKGYEVSVAFTGDEAWKLLEKRQPDLMVMDEPLAGVDLHSQAGLAQLLGGLRDAGLGLLVVLHERGPMGDVLDRTVTLCDGRVVPDEHTHPAEECSPPAEPSAVGLVDPADAPLTSASKFLLNPG